MQCVTRSLRRSAPSFVADVLIRRRCLFPVLTGKQAGTCLFQVFFERERRFLGLTERLKIDILPTQFADG